MRTKLTDYNSIGQVIAELSLDEKLNLVGEYKASHTLAIPDMDIPSLLLMDGVTGVNGTQAVLDYLTSPEFYDSVEESQKAYMLPDMAELMTLNLGDLQELEEKYKDDAYRLGLVKYLESLRPNGKDYISFPSGVNVGASFDRAAAEKLGEAIGCEMRDSGIDVCFGPNVDIARDPLGGRNYEMYGEDPTLVSDMGAAVIQGIQSKGVAACAKHFMANNQETKRNTKDTHVSKRTLMEIYSRGFEAAVEEGRTKCIMTAYNAINGVFSSYNKELVTDLLRGEWNYDGLVLTDWGAASANKEDSLAAGLDLLTCGPTDMSACRQAVLNGTLPEDVLNDRVAHILKLIVELREEKQQIPFTYEPERLLQTAEEMAVKSSVLLKNEDHVLPLNGRQRVTFYGKRSKDMLEFGSGSTAVQTNLHSNVFDEYAKQNQNVTYEKMDGADVLIYVAAAPAGENVDRAKMDIEDEDAKRMPVILKEAKEKGLHTVVVLNVAGPVEMRTWIAYADSILCVFIPGCMGGKAAAAILAGTANPEGRLPVTFPVKYKDTPSYPNFPGENNDVYYGEGIFVGYRFYEKKELPVQFPFGYGLSYTEFEQELLQHSFVLDAETEDALEVPVRVKNTGSRKGSQVIQIYAGEKAPRVLRPEKELVGFEKTELEPGEEKVVSVMVKKKSLCYYDAELEQWVQPVGELFLKAGTSAEDIFAEAALTVTGKSAYRLNANSAIRELIQNPKAVELLVSFVSNLIPQGGQEASMLESMDFNSESMAMMMDFKLADLLSMLMISIVPDAVQAQKILQELYDQLEQL